MVLLICCISQLWRAHLKIGCPVQYISGHFDQVLSFHGDLIWWPHPLARHGQQFDICFSSWSGTHWFYSWVGCFPSWHQATRSPFNSWVKFLAQGNNNNTKVTKPGIKPTTSWLWGWCPDHLAMLPHTYTLTHITLHTVHIVHTHSRHELEASHPEMMLSRDVVTLSHQRRGRVVVHLCLAISCVLLNEQWLLVYR